MAKQYPSPHLRIGDEWDAEAWDDVTGDALDIKQLREARKEEMKFVEGIPVYDEVDIAEAWKSTGRAPICTKWVDVKKMGDDGEWAVRSRWVARDFKVKGDDLRADLFASMPPLEAKKMLFKWARMKVGGKRQDKVLCLVDVKKAHLNAVCDDVVFVQLPEEAKAPGKCGKLRRWSYGMRPAAQGWER